MFRPYGSIVPNPPTKVSDLINNTTASWNIQLLQATFIPIDVQTILRIPLCTRNILDFWAWHFEKHGSFSIKSAYNMLVATKQRKGGMAGRGPQAHLAQMRRGSVEIALEDTSPGENQNVLVEALETLITN